MWPTKGHIESLVKKEPLILNTKDALTEFSDLIHEAYPYNVCYDEVLIRKSADNKLFLN